MQQYGHNCFLEIKILKFDSKFRCFCYNTLHVLCEIRVVGCGHQVRKVRCCDRSGWTGPGGWAAAGSTLHPGDVTLCRMPPMIDPIVLPAVMDRNWAVINF